MDLSRSPDGFPIVVPVRKDATPEQISQVFEGARALVERLGLATRGLPTAEPG